VPAYSTRGGYSASKAAIEGLSDSLAQEIAARSSSPTERNP
jgi:NAD(P)-dependent dehydrogenase (short-subunit alcohol dehydrogenase family)